MLVLSTTPSPFVSGTGRLVVRCKESVDIIVCKYQYVTVLSLANLSLFSLLSGFYLLRCYATASSTVATSS